MPRGKIVRETPAKMEQNRLMWGIFGGEAKVSVLSWDPKQVQLVDAILHVLDSGSSVFIRPGSGGGSIGIAIWEENNRWPAKWCYTSEEVDAWAAAVLEAAEANSRSAAD